MKPIALILTDTHLHDGNIELVEDIWRQAIDRCNLLKIDKIFFGGDFFTSRKSQSLAVLSSAQRIFNSVEGADIDLIGIKGNHDAVDAESEDSYLDIFSDKINLHRGYGFEELKNNVIVHFLPYFKEDVIYPQYLEKAVKSVSDINSGCLIKTQANVPKYKHILLTHVAINGVRNNDASVVENNLKKNQFDCFHSVLVGHYHNQSQIGDNIFYIGSAYQSNYGEDNQKGFTIIMDDGSHTFVKSKFKEFIKVKIDITDEKAIKQLEKEFKNSKDNVRFVFEGEEAELKNVNKEKYAALGIDVTFNKDSAVPLNHEGLIEKANSISFDRSNVELAFATFCETKHIEDNSIGLEYLKQI